MSFKFAPAALAAFSLACLMGCGVGSTSPNSTTTTTAAPTVTSIAVSPSNSAVSVGKSLQLKAKATLSDGSTKDITSTASWGSTDTSVATVSSGTVKGLKFGLISIKVHSGSANASTLVNVTQKNFSNGSLKGSYVFRITTPLSAGALQLELGSIKADGSGNITGVEDLNSSSGVQTEVSLKGTYSVLSDGRGTLKLDTTGLSSRTFHFVLSSNSGASTSDNNAYLVQFDGNSVASGTLKTQDTSAFQNSSLSNNTYVFRVGGSDPTQKSVSTVGEFTTDASGMNITGGTEDVNDNGVMNNGNGGSNPVSVTAGTIGAVDAATGRATVSMTAHTAKNLVLYMVSSSAVELLGTDAQVTVTGTAEKQTSPLPSALGPGGYAFSADSGGIPGQFWMIGQFQVDSTGAVTGLTQNQAGGVALSFAIPTGTTSVGANGRGTLKENTTHGTFTFDFYLISANKMYLLQPDDSHAASGTIQLQEPGPEGFGTGTLNNTFVFGATGVLQTGTGNISVIAQVVADGAGHLTGVEDVSQPQPGNPSQVSTSTVAFSANYLTPSTAGATQGTVSTPGAGVQTLDLYLVSSSKALMLGLAPGTVDGALVLQ
jgi:hypothetical protein